ncbi:N-acetylmuramoyl-L-alanine amidase [Streptococcus oralis subsp. oralis]|uniref:N-acetylmuramoyl-L-alanine amidase n=1 Tax=Streptococcus oralis subsp. oralis TaxID=1891914 RepID=A0A1X1GX13_STROR|nr:N-acetylmuramoyl-L-alanine amidase [Streptococcus oralis]ORO51397.1 N-acetylmuramoyl-L-alanine amidase [Streptococcus oralis subsp. oralis]
MKKILLTSALILSIAGLAPASVLGEENTTQSTSAVKEAIAKEEKKESSVEENSKSEALPKVDVQEDKPKKEGWYQENHHWRFYQDDKPALNWKQIQGKWYYFDQDGNRLHSTIYKGYAFDQDGVMIENSWTNLDNQWYYSDSSGRLAQNTWKKINGAWYYFDQTGIMLSKTSIDGYFLGQSGAMASQGWQEVNHVWYYVLPSGKISQDKWEKIKGTWYYFDKEGRMLSETTFKGYLFKKSGALAENNWVKIKDTWFYANGSGRYVQDKWQKIQGSWYSFTHDGGMLADKWQGSYYLKTSGAMAEKEWIFDKTYKSWFYLKADGHYANQEWIGAYYLKSGGYMAKSEWIDDSQDKGRYYLDENGRYVTGIHKISGKDHLFQKDGKWISEVSTEGGFVKGQYSKTIFLDPGHGGRDSGAFYYNVAEKDLNMQIYRKLRTKLEELGYKVLTSRDSDIDVDFVTERSRMVNKTNSDIFISIHFNATGSAYSKASGIQTYSYSDEPDYPSKINQYWHNHPDRMSESKRLAAAIHSSLLAETGAKDAGLLESSYAVLRETAKPAVLLELGYMDNFSENQQIRDSHYQDKLVAGIVKGIQKYYAGK